VYWVVQVIRAEIDLLRGDADAAAGRWRQIYALPAVTSRVDFSYESAPLAVEAFLWAGRPGDALAEAQRALALFKVPDLTILSGRLLTAGMRACAVLAEQARARRDQPGAAAAEAAADSLSAWVGQMGGASFADHPFAATIPAERATWEAERTRMAGCSDPDAWAGAAKAWQDLGWRHWAAYGWWRQAQAELEAGQPAAAVAGALRAAAATADGHVPLLDQIRVLAERARIPLRTPADDVPPATAAPQAQGPAPYRLTGRELAGCGCSPPDGPPPRSAPSCTSARRRPACTSATSCASWASPAGCRQPRWPYVPTCCPRHSAKHRRPESKHP
jgi:hypothetical protein